MFVHVHVLAIAAIVGTRDGAYDASACNTRVGESRSQLILTTFYGASEDRAAGVANPGQPKRAGYTAALSRASQASNRAASVGKPDGPKHTGSVSARDLPSSIEADLAAVQLVQNGAKPL